jgi:hypothetical protein
VGLQPELRGRDLHAGRRGGVRSGMTMMMTMTMMMMMMMMMVTMTMIIII